MNIHARGFIALMSALVISAVLLLVVTSSNLAGFYGRFNQLDSELKERSRATADACVSVALLAFAEGLDPSGRTVTLNRFDECRIAAVTGMLQKTFKVQATSSKSAVTTLLVTADAASASLVSLQEISTF